MSVLWHHVPETITATLSWKTEVLSSYNSEQRVKRRITPRLSLVYGGDFYDQEIFEFLELAKSGKNSFFVPDYRYAQYVTQFSSVFTTVALDTDSFYSAVGDQLLFYTQDASYLATIAGIGTGQVTLQDGPATPLAGAYVVPVLNCYSVDGLRAQHKTSVHAAYQIEFVTDSYYDLAAKVTLPAYRSNPVYPDRTTIDGAGVSMQNRVTVKDSSYGAVLLQDRFNHVDSGDSLSFKDTSLATMFRREAILHNFYGKLKPVWKSSDRKDLILNGDAGSGASTIAVRTGITDTAVLIGKDICIAVSDGSRYYHRVAGCSIASGIASLTLSPVLTADLTVASTKTVSVFSLYRLAADSVMLRVSPGITAIGSVALEYLGNEE